MSESDQWRQLGTIVNTILMGTRSKAIRRGTLSKTTPQPPQRIGFLRKMDSGLNFAEKSGNGFLAKEAPATVPKQLELPFGIAEGGFGSARTPRGVRVM